MGATRESLLRISSSSGSGGGGGGSGGREGGKDGGVETDAWRSLVVINGVLAECVRANDTKGATQMLRVRQRGRKGGRERGEGGEGRRRKESMALNPLSPYLPPSFLPSLPSFLP